MEFSPFHEEEDLFPGVLCSDGETLPLALSASQLSVSHSIPCVQSAVSGFLGKRRSWVNVEVIICLESNAPSAQLCAGSMESGSWSLMVGDHL